MIEGERRRGGVFGQLYVQVLIGILLGAVLGFLDPKLGAVLKPLGDAFVKLIHMLLAPIIFGTVVVGIAKMGNIREVGRVGVKAIIYFEVLSTIALAIGLIVANLLQPGRGMNVDPATLDSKSVAAYASTAHKQSVVDFFLNIIPSSIADAFAHSNMLQIIFFSILFGLALAMLPDRGRAVVEVFDGILNGLFGIVRMVMRVAPLGAFGAMAFTVGQYGVESLASLAKLALGAYATSLIFVFVVLAVVARLAGISLWKFLRYIKDEIFITFATVSTEAVLPRMMAKLEDLGCDKPVVGMVLPAGYTFNADGTSIYLTMATIFVAQATNTPLSLTDQLVILGVAMLTSKGSAGVAGAGFVALAGTLGAIGSIPVAGLVLLLGVDRFVNEARAVTNLIGNGIGTVAVARWEGAFDERRAHAVLNGAAPEPKRATG